MPLSPRESASHNIPRYPTISRFKTFDRRTGRYAVQSEVGLATNFFVIEAQQDLATAQETELRAILDYQLAIIEFERVQQTSLGVAGISIVGG